MGGIMMLLAILVAVAVWCNFTPALCIAMLLTFGHALIGFVDDYIKVVMKRNLGLTAAQKFFMQFVLAGAYVYYIETPWPYCCPEVFYAVCTGRGVCLLY